MKRLAYKSKLGTYDVSRCYEIAQANRRCGPFKVMLLPELIAIARANPHIDEARAMTIPLSVATAEPLLCIMMPPTKTQPQGSLHLIDGNHRMLRMSAVGLTRFDAYVIPLDLQPPMISGPGKGSSA